MDSLTKIRLNRLADEIANETTLNPALYEAFKSVDRGEFISIQAHAYDLNAQPILGNQWISSPLTVAKMTMALEFEDADSVLEIGCGSGYQAAILSRVIRRVFSVERISRLVDEAKRHFANLEISNINVRYDDGNLGWKTYAPYDRILLSAATKKIDERLFSQLKVGGILVAPIQKENRQFIVKFIKIDENSVRDEILEECEFVPLLDGIE